MTPTMTRTTRIYSYRKSSAALIRSSLRNAPCGSVLWKAVGFGFCVLYFSFNGNPAVAQSVVPAGIASPAYSLTDQNGIILTSNKPSAHVADLSIGSKERPFGHSIVTDYYASFEPTIEFVDGLRGKVRPPYSWEFAGICNHPNVVLDVYVGVSAETMCGTNGVYTPIASTGTSMITNADGSVTYTMKDGTTILYGMQSITTEWPPLKVTRPDGLITTYYYKVVIDSGSTFYRVQSIARNDGLQLKYRYGSDTPPTISNFADWNRIASVTGVNNAVEYCDPMADSCTFAKSWPTATQTWSTSGSLTYLAVLDPAGRSTRFTMGVPVVSGGTYVGSGPFTYNSTQLLAMRRPTSSSTDSVVYTWCADYGEVGCMSQGVKRVTTDGYDWTYTATAGHGGPSTFFQLTASNPLGAGTGTTSQSGNTMQGPLISFSDSFSGRSYSFDSSLANHLSSVSSGDGDKLDYSYDSRSNITKQVHSPAAGSPLPSVTTSADYDATCVNPVKCNKPNWVKDGNQNQTDYSYDPAHGGVLKVTSPADTNGIRPETRYGYTQRYAWYKNSSGAIVQASSPLWVLTTEKFCRSSAALSNGTGCSGTAGPYNDEVTTIYDYGPTSGANNLFLRGKSITADGVTLRTCYRYDIYGNEVSETTPNAGLSTCP